jgi:hypothetical protein
MTRKSLPLLVALASFGLVAAFSSSALAEDAPQPPVPLEGKNEKVVAQAESGGAAAAPAGGEGVKDSAAQKTEKEEEEQHKNPFAGSIFLFDQSATTNSFSKGSQLSYSPLYEWWISPRVYYTVAKHFKFGARFDFFKEFTNHEETTTKGEWVITDPWLTAAYGDQASFFGKHEKSRFSLGLLVRPGVSKASRANDQYMSAGPTGSLSYGFDVLGSKSKFLQSASIGLYVSYSHAFTKSQQPGDISRPATDVNGNMTLNQSIRSSTLVGNSLIYSLNGEIDILETLSYGASMIWIDQFAYRTPDIAGMPRSDNDTHFRQSTWFLTSVDYNPIKELGISLGYYNLNTAIGPDGKRRNVLWSPDARVFFSLTANLDAIMDDVTKPKQNKANTAIANFRAFQ